MKRYFSLENHKDAVLARLANVIKEIYPIGVDFESEEYSQYPGIKRITDLIQENIGNEKRYKEIWVSFLNKLRNYGKEIKSTTYGFGAGLSADMILERYEDESLVRVKKITFAVSLLGPFYSVCGVDETFIKIKEQPGCSGHHAINVVTVSPFQEFEADFVYLQKQIEEQFKGYQFVPFSVCFRFVKGLSMAFTIRNEFTVYNALFNRLFDYYNYEGSLLRGDTLYGYDKSKLAKVILTAPPSNKE